MLVVMIYKDAKLGATLLAPIYAQNTLQVFHVLIDLRFQCTQRLQLFDRQIHMYLLNR